MLKFSGRFMQNVSIRNKLIAFIVGISASAIFMSSTVQVIYGVNYSRDVLLDELAIMARVIGDQSTAALEFFDPASAKENLSSLKEHDAMILACLYDESEQLFSIYIHEKVDTLSRFDCPEILFESTERENNAHVWHTIERSGIVLGYLYLESELTVVRQFAQNFSLVVLSVFSVSLLMAYLLTARLHHIISSPILDLVHVAKQLSSAGNYSVRAKPVGDDELGTLVIAFNDMLDQIQERDSQLHQLNSELEHKVDERTKALQKANESLNESLDELNHAQDQLVQSEKMAALGELVAGVAHEINTPVGVAVTAASHFEVVVKHHVELYQKGSLSRGDFENFMGKASEISEMVLVNLKRAADLVSSFKQLAVDQSSGERRSFNLKEYIRETLVSLQPKFKRTHHHIEVNCPDDYEMYSHPGAIAQVLTNLLMNSLIHGFDDIEHGHISIDVEAKEDEVVLSYRDNGKGIKSEHLKKIFDPFFTTKRGLGGSGLGMNIVYNIVTQTLGGTIACNSEEGMGVEFKLILPRVA